MPRLALRKKVVSQSLKTKKLCPHCGHDEFEVTESKFSWLFGQRFVCAKCKGTFKKANLVRVSQKELQSNLQKTSSYHKTKQKKRKWK